MSDKESNIKDTAAKKGVFTVSVKSSFFWVELVRKIIQFLSFVLFNGAILGLSIVPLVLPVLWTSGSPHGTVGEAFGVLQGLIYNIIFPWLPLASIFLFAVFTGRFLCGWVCPFGFIQDLLNYIKKRKRDISVPTHKNLIYVKYFILTLTFIISIALAAESVSPTGPIFGKILGVFAQAPFTALSPSDTVFAVVPKMFSFFYQNGYQNFWVSLSSPLLWTRLV
ncbi:MAG: 4Fe-4S binding protein, partial [Candidatus Bathyarchaeia archaeon]